MTSRRPNRMKATIALRIKCGCASVKDTVSFVFRLLLSELLTPLAVRANGVRFGGMIRRSGYGAR